MTQPTLFSPVTLGSIACDNRIAMAPLTRNRARPEDDTPYGLHAEYYAQRAAAGLIITEGSQISPTAKGYAWTPGIYSPAQIAGWKLVTDAVHAKGGKIVIQLWHVGRVSHTSLQPGGAAPVAPCSTGGAFRHRGRFAHLYRRKVRAYLDAPRFDAGRDRRHRGRLCAGHPQRPRGGV